MADTCRIKVKPLKLTLTDDHEMSVRVHRILTDAFMEWDSRVVNKDVGKNEKRRPFSRAFALQRGYNFGA